jgi:hypothetical protein
MEIFSPGMTVIWVEAGGEVTAEELAQLKEHCGLGPFTVLDVHMARDATENEGHTQVLEILPGHWHSGAFFRAS